ncbi:MAG: hypothetical protein WD944_01780 [Steroidobacteraceae bacterium]
MAEAGAVVIIHLFADLAADDRADGRARQYCDQAIVAVADRSADCATDDGAERGADAIAIAATSADTVVIPPMTACIADIIRIMFLAPAMRGRMWRRISDCAQREGQGGNSEHRRGGKEVSMQFHGVPPA